MERTHARLLVKGWWAVAISLAMLASIALALALPGDAAAGAPQKAAVKGGGAPQKTTEQVYLAPTTYKGWAYLNLNACPSGKVCTAIYRTHTTGYRWTGKGWQAVSVPGGWVYVWPYSGSWRYVWTQSTGWVVVGSGQFELRYS